MKTSGLIKLVKKATKVKVWINGCGGLEVEVSKTQMIRHLSFNLRHSGDNQIDERTLNNGILYL